MQSTALCSVEGCVRKVRCVELCEMHYRRYLRTGMPEGVGRIGRPKAAEATYAAMHLRLGRSRGKARLRKCVACASRADEWAYDHQGAEERISEKGRPYSLDLDSYVPMCHSCHVRFDAHMAALRRGGEVLDTWPAFFASTS